MNITVLDSFTLGSDIDLHGLSELGDTKVYASTSCDEISERIADSEIVILNKVKIGKKELESADKLKLICITATGFDNVDIDECRKKNIAVCNVKGYSTDSVAQTTLALALALVMHIPFYDRFVKTGEYTGSGIQNRLEPVFYELRGKTWGIVGYGDIGKQVAKAAEAMGCKIIAFSRTHKDGVENADIDTLCKKADIISVHLPLTDSTKHIIGRKQLDLMKSSAFLINTARGAVIDEKAVADAIRKKKIAGFATDVYSVEPMTADNPISEIVSCDNVVLTPHLAWGAYEARVRCVDEVIENINAFVNGTKRNRVDTM